MSIHARARAAATAAIATRYAQGGSVRHDELAALVVAALERNGLTIVTESEMEARERYSRLLEDAHATICLLLERAGGEVELPEGELAAARHRRYSMVTVRRADGTLALAAYRPL